MVALLVGLFAVPAWVGASGAQSVPDASGAQSVPDAIERPDRPIPGEYVVVLQTNPGGNVTSLANSLARQYGGEVMRVYDAALAGFSVRMSDAQAQGLARNPFVKTVAQNGVVSLAADTTQSSPTWGIDRVDQQQLPLDAQYRYAENGDGVTAYIVDTGIRFTHTQFGGRASKGTDAINGGTASDCNGHGTHVAGTVGGATYGVAKQVTLKAVRVLGCNGSGTWDQVISGVNWVAADHAAGAPAVANMSLGGGKYTPLNDAVAGAVADGVTFAVAAGNSNANACNYSPSSTPSAITVAATDNTDTRASFSNYGTCVDIFGPGVNITSSWYSSDTATNTISGTSMATPHVAGVAALYLQLHPTASPATVAADLVANAGSGLVTDPMTGTPNKLLYSGFLLGTTPPPPTTTTTTTTTTSSTTTTTMMATIAAGAPASLVGTAKKKGAQLTWGNPVSGGTPTGYRVYRATGSSTSYSLVASLGLVTSFTNTNLRTGTSYSYYVTATNSSGEGPASNIVTVTAL